MIQRGFRGKAHSGLPLEDSGEKPFEAPGVRFFNPVRVEFGRGLAAGLPGRLTRPVLVVCGRSGPSRWPALCREEAGWHCAPVVEPNPSPGTVDEVAARARELSAVTLVGLGGGSAMDVARLAACMQGNCQSVAELLEEPAPLRAPSLVQVPTTAGSGSEVTPFATLWQRGTKTGYEHPVAFADLAVVDPELSQDLPARLTLATGLDCLAHAVESLWGRNHNPVSDALAIRSLDLVRRHLPVCLERPQPGDREAMARAATLAGMALSSCRSGGAHALSYPLTGLLGLEHGLATGVCCRALLPWTLGRAPERCQLIMLGLGVDSLEQALAFLDSLFHRVGLRPSLSALSTTPADPKRIARLAMQSNRMANHPVPPSQDELLGILETIL